MTRRTEILNDLVKKFPNVIDERDGKIIKFFYHEKPDFKNPILIGTLDQNERFQSAIKDEGQESFF